MGKTRTSSSRAAPEATERSGPSGGGEREVAAGVVVRKALFRAAEALGSSQRDVAAMVGVSEATVSRWSQGTASLEPATKSFELALLFLRIFRGLDALMGGDEAKARAWLDADNAHLNGVPRERLTSVEGIADVARYLDAMRGRL